MPKERLARSTLSQPLTTPVPPSDYSEPGIPPTSSTVVAVGGFRLIKIRTLHARPHLTPSSSMTFRDQTQLKYANTRTLLNVRLSTDTSFYASSTSNGQA
ncbi:hypothetical protein D9757_014322 [Collybiopsis confluens]|uniref:Uncharacterized protein n=1 Tax=Collybiopsis confluens TaxID=2823264 RepID=A0A8H5FSU5_9AGAR|nr:hypothetical protein D9757_014322 [Collybiopsis confluens]